MNRPDTDSHGPDAPVSLPDQQTPFDGLEIKDEDLIAIKDELMDFTTKDLVDETRQIDAQIEDHEEVALEDSVNETNNDENVHADSLTFLDLAEKDSDGAPNQIEDKFQSDEDVVQDDSEYETEDVEDDYSTDMSNSHRRRRPILQWKENKSVHTIEKKKNSNKSILNKLKNKPKTALKCNYCEKYFKRPFELKRHILTHTGEKPFACNECNKKFTQKGALYSHLRMMHGTEPNLPVRTNADERSLQCEYCPKKCDCPSKLIAHMRSHTGERPFECDECGKTFKLRGDLNRHGRDVHGITNAISMTKNSRAS